jgi:hypothetical protein
MLLRAQVTRRLLLLRPPCLRLLLATLLHPCQPLACQQLLLRQPGEACLAALLLLLPRHPLLRLRLLLLTGMAGA